MRDKTKKKTMAKALWVYLAVFLGMAVGAVPLMENGSHAKTSSEQIAAQSPDKVPPEVVFVSPADKTKDVQTLERVTIVFNERMDPVTISPHTIELRDDRNNLMAAFVTYDNKSHTVFLDLRSPVGDYRKYLGKMEYGLVNKKTTSGKVVPKVKVVKFAKKTKYTATVVGGDAGVKDLAGNTMKKSYTWSFTTVPEEDTLRPSVTSISPADGSVDVNTGTDVLVTFSEPMDPKSINSGAFMLRDLSNKRIPASILYDSDTNTANLILRVPLAGEYKLANNTTYTATVVGGDAGVKDLAGNPMQIDFSWSFTTAAF